MKNFKIVLGFILVGIAALVVFQNKEFFFHPLSLKMNIGVAPSYQTLELPNVVWFLACFLVSLLIAYFFSLLDRFKSRKTIKELNAKNNSLLDMISQLRKELEARGSSETDG